MVPVSRDNGVFLNVTFDLWPRLEAWSRNLPSRESETLNDDFPLTKHRK